MAVALALATGPAGATAAAGSAGDAAAPADCAQGGAGPVAVVEVDGLLDPVLVDFIDDQVRAAERACAVALVLLPTLYAVLLGVGRRGLTWPVLALLLGGFVALRELTDVDPRPVFLVLAAAALGVAVVHGRGRHAVLLQTAGVVGFGGAALLAALVAPQVAVWLVAAALLVSPAA